MKWILILIIFFINSLFASGYKVYKNKCSSCHQEYVEVPKLIENFEKNNTILNLKAPTINQLSFRLKQMIGDRELDEEIHLFEVSEFIKDYVINPDKDKSVCLDIVISNFETMESMRGKITTEELEMVSEWIYYFDENLER